MLFWTAFLLGLAGSTHCAGMCGPLAIAAPAGASRRAFVAGRIALNAGRMITYSGLGAIFGLFGKTLLLAGVQRWASIALGIALLAGLLVSGKLGAWIPVTRLVEQVKSGMGRLLRRRSVGALVVLGLLNGLLPCGLVYVAATGATASGSVLAGVAYMAVFGLGTVPMMLAIGLSRNLVPFALRLKLQRTVPVSVFLLAALLILRGMSLGIPHLSPNLAAPESCCHK
jgi:hypothetical protein